MHVSYYHLPSKHILTTNHHFRVLKFSKMSINWLQIAINSKTVWEFYKLSFLKNIFHIIVNNSLQHITKTYALLSETNPAMAQT